MYEHKISIKYHRPTDCPFCQSNVAGLYSINDPQFFMSKLGITDLYLICDNCSLDEVAIAIQNQYAVDNYDPYDDFAGMD